MRQTIRDLVIVGGLVGLLLGSADAQQRPVAPPLKTKAPSVTTPTQPITTPAPTAATQTKPPPAASTSSAPATPSAPSTTGADVQVSSLDETDGTLVLAVDDGVITQYLVEPRECHVVIFAAEKLGGYRIKVSADDTLLCDQLRSAGVHHLPVKIVGKSDIVNDGKWTNGSHDPVVLDPMTVVKMTADKIGVSF